MLTEDDETRLQEAGYIYTTTTADNGWTHLVLKDYQLPDGFDPPQTDLLVKLPPGFPDTAPDMFWVDPPVRIEQTGASAPATDLIEQIDGRPWQRFSRHLAPGAWRPGVDDLFRWLTAIRRLLEKDVSG